jgi:hypothetical protein
MPISELRDSRKLQVPMYQFLAHLGGIAGRWTTGVKISGCYDKNG